MSCTNVGTRMWFGMMDKNSGAVDNNYVMRFVRS